MQELSGTLEVRSLRVHFQGLKAVDGVDLVLKPPEILGLIGPNGAGKTTVVNAITGFQEPSDGSVFFEGSDVTGLPAEKLARRGISRTFQGVRLFGGLSAFQNVEVAAIAAGQRRPAARQIADELVEQAGLGARAHLRGDVLTTGEEHLLGVARALASGPKILLLDEPTAGLNDEETSRFMAYLRMIRESENLALMIIEHDMRVIMGLCDRIQVLNYGHTIGVGTPEEIRGNHEVREAYLGTVGDSQPADRRLGEAVGQPDPGPGPAASQPMLEVRDLYVAYDRSEAVRGLSLRVGQGEMVGLIGPNGAGKTTTLAAIVGLIRPKSGTVLLGGEIITGLSSERIAGRGVALVPEGRRIFSKLTVAENLLLGCTLRSDQAAADADLEAVLDRFPALRKYYDRAAGTLSGGEQQQLAIARALLARPSLLILDEPSLGLAPRLVDLVFDVVLQLKEGGVTTLLVEQNAVRTVATVDRTYILRAGEIVASGTRDELANSIDLSSVYLG